MARALALMLLLVAGCGPRCPQPAPVSAPASRATSAAVIGETFRITSKVLGEERVVNVYLPPGYQDGKDRYPVLYMPDGGMAEDFPHISGHVDVSIKNAVIRPIIVVGVENTERRRDLPGPTTIAEELAAAPRAGGSDTFRRFLGDELKPYIAAHYRVTAESALIGESLAGLFVIETLLVEPALFDAYISVDPSVWWNQASLVKGASARFATWKEAPKTLFVATADYKDTQDAVAVLMAAIEERHPVGLVAVHAPMPEEHHSTIFPFAALRGIRLVFAMPPAPEKP